MKAILITGNTYPQKKEIKYGCGGKWDRDLKGWICPFENFELVKIVCEKYDFSFEDVEVEDDYFKPLEGENLREVRQEQFDHKREKWESMIAVRERKIKELEDSTPSYEKDYAFITQPLMPGHHSYRSHLKARERMTNRMDKIHFLYEEMGELKDKLKYNSKVRIKGDAERERQSKREEQDKLISKGSKIIDFAFGIGEVTRINKKTYSIKFKGSGSTYARDKTFVKFIK